VSEIVIDSVQFSDDGVSINYAMIDDALRDDGMLMKTQTLHVASRHHDYDIIKRVERLLHELVELSEIAYRTQPAYDPTKATPEEPEVDEEEEELGGRWG
jgi:hypothetical protein